MSKLTHLDKQGAARMVDVSGKEASDREAMAEAEAVIKKVIAAKSVEEVRSERLVVKIFGK